MSMQLYSGLDPSKQEIRVLVVNTSALNNDGTLICRLETVSLLDEPTPHFEALSWTWGDPTHSKHIIIDGHEVGVSANAEEVLRRVCYDQKYDRVWLDAVCINQSDLNERGQQVSLMGDIYSKTARVLIWLGQEDETTEAGLKDIDQILAQCHESTNGFKDLENHFFDANGSRRYSDVPLPKCDWPAVLRYYSAPYFFRVWIHQEVMLCKEGICFRGAHSRSWTDISLAAQWMSHTNFRSHSRHVTDDPGVGVDKCSRIWRFTRRPPGLTGFLSMATYLQATNSLDKVYGMLGILKRSGGDIGDIVPSYHAKLGDVYAQATRAAVKADGLVALEMAQALVPQEEQQTGPDDNDWPSWVPHYDWRDYRPGGSPAMPDLPLRIGASAGEPMALSEDMGHPNTLVLKGCIIDTITDLSNILTIDLILNAQDIAQEISICRAVVPLVMDVDFATTILSGLDYSRSGSQEGIMNEYRQFAIEARAKLTGQCHPELLHDKNSLTYFSNTAWDYANTMNVHSRNRRFFVTEKGYMGTAFPKTEVGDKVCILYGGMYPAVLRPVGEYWRLVGTAFVQGIMEGEYVQTLRTADRLQEESQYFRIC